MSECTCHKNYTLDTLIPQVGVITDIRQETPDVKTFRVNAPEGGKLFEHMPGQCAMVCVPGFSEGLKLMKPGGRYRIVIPASLGYGAQGVPGDIPPNAALDFHIDLLEILPKPSFQ